MKKRRGNGMRRQRGFTYGEMIVIIGLLLLFASTAVLNLVPMQKNSDLRVFRAKLRAMAGEARTRSMDIGETVALIYDKNERILTSAIQNSKEGQEREIERLPIPEGIEPTQFSADQRESSTDGWRVPFYPDGTSAGGGIEFEAGEKTFSLTIQRADGLARVDDGLLPDLSSDQWQAGDYERRQ